MKITLRDIIADPIHFLAFGFGSGLSPKAPGTVGTLVAMIFMPLLAQLSLVQQITLIIVAFVAGVWICGRSSKRLGVHDHGGIVWDEFVGYWIAAMFLPPEPIWWLAAFVVFRVFDIAKPWPICLADSKLDGGLGIMLDDVLAGLMALLSLNLVLYFIG